MELKRILSIFILLPVLYILPGTIEAQKVKRVVIDAGHGGHDSGAVGKMSKEKDIALSIALKTGRYIKENLKDIEVIYTRKTDVFVELYRRARIANEAKADLFISIHCNANPSPTPYGSETYVMGLHRTDANLAVAQLENAAILLEDDYHVQYEGFDPRSPEGFIFFSMLQNAFMDQSLDLASRVQWQFREKVSLHDRGVKQAGFLVLYKTTMPSILIETAFISNSKEEKILSSEEGQNNIASAIYRAIKEYKHTVERTVPGPDYISGNDGQLASDADSADHQPKTVNETKSGILEKIQSDASEQGLVFRVQFYISKSKLAPDAREFKGLDNVSHYRHMGMYKYTIGNEQTPGDAQKLITLLNKKGFKDAFVVAFLNGERISLDEGKKLLKN